MGDWYQEQCQTWALHGGTPAKVKDFPKPPSPMKVLSEHLRIGVGEP